MRSVLLVWPLIIGLFVVPVTLAAASPLLAWRDPVYIASGFAGIAALSLLLLQPLLAAGLLPGLSMRRARQIHRFLGFTLVLTVILHVVGLWITSPPDVIDALLFSSPTPFSDWGVVAMWTLFLVAAIALFRRKLRLSPKTWRRVHMALAVVVIIGSAVHALRVEGTMELFSKVALCLSVSLSAAWAVFRLN